MARGFNKVILIGNLARDPELKTTVQGKNVVNIVLAVDDSYKDNKRTYFFEVICWEPLTEIVKKYTKKGDKLLIEGRLTQSKWEKTDQNGNKITQTFTRIVAENIVLLTPKGKEETVSKEEVSKIPASTTPQEEDIRESDYKEYQETSVGYSNNYEEGETFDDTTEDYDDDFEIPEDENFSYDDLEEEEEDNIKNINPKKDFDI